MAWPDWPWPSYFRTELIYATACSGAATIRLAPCKWWHEPTTKSFQVEGHRAGRWCGSSYHIRTSSLKLVDLPVPKIRLIFDHGVKRPGTLTFDLWMGLQVTCVGWASVLPNFSFLRRSFLDLGSGTWQTDGRTERQRPSMHNAPSLWRQGIISATRTLTRLRYAVEVRLEEWKRTWNSFVVDCRVHHFARFEHARHARQVKQSRRVEERAHVCRP